MKSYLFLAIALLLVGCAVNDLENSAILTSEAEAEPPRSQRIYYFQHKLISNWIFNSDGAFFFDIQHGNDAQLMEVAAKVVAPEYAEGIVITPIIGRDAVSFRFPAPDSLANCYYSLVKKDEDSYAYYTYEKTMSFGDEEFVGVVGGWDNKGEHSNYGPRTYKTEQEFIEDILKSK